MKIRKITIGGNPIPADAIIRIGMTNNSQYSWQAMASDGTIIETLSVNSSVFSLSEILQIVRNQLGFENISSASGAMRALYELKYPTGYELRLLESLNEAMNDEIFGTLEVFAKAKNGPRDERGKRRMPRN